MNSDRRYSQARHFQNIIKRIDSQGSEAVCNAARKKFGKASVVYIQSVLIASLNSLERSTKPRKEAA